MATLALGYGLSYLIFALTIRTSGLEGINSRQIISGFAFGFAPVAILSVLWLRGRVNKRSVLPSMAWGEALSGVATASIAVSTVYALATQSVSVVLALVLMRGGVLLISPLIDWSHRRSVEPVSWSAFALSLLAVSVGIFANNSNGLELHLIGILSVYLLGYAIRLTLMIRFAKRNQEGRRATWFSSELSFTTVFLLVAGAVFWLQSPATAPPLFTIIIGALYAVVLVFGSLIYLDPRETTFAVPINRAASLCAGIVGAFFLAGIGEASLPPWTDVLAAALVSCALVLLLRQDAAARAMSPNASARVASTPKT
ncbi:MAG: hypothetical protein AAF830_09210 [Pseudomonadota bacterium]